MGGKMNGIENCKETNEWCKVKSDGNKVTFFCLACKQEHIFDNTGMYIVRFLDMCDAFCNLHRECGNKLGKEVK